MADILVSNDSLLRLGRRAWRRLRYSTAQHLRYQRWFWFQMRMSGAARHLVHQAIAHRETSRPISILLPILDATPRMVRVSIESVAEQLLPHWELCIAAQPDIDRSTARLLARYRRTDPRIKVENAFSQRTAGDVANAALSLATGDFVAILKCGDRLSDVALFCLVETLSTHPETDLVYSDEDQVGLIGHCNPSFKPGWDRELILGKDYFNGLGVYRRALVDKAGRFHGDNQDVVNWDLVLRCSRLTQDTRIRHIPYVLYHRRKAPARENVSQAAIKKTIASHLAASGESAEIEFSAASGAPWIRFRTGNISPRTCLIIPTRDRLDLLRKCVSSIWNRTSYDRFEVIIIDNRSSDPFTLEYLDQLAESGKARILRYDKPFNWSAINNFAVKHTDAPIVGLINNDVEVASSHWLEEMVSLSARPRVGAVGAFLLYPDRTVQHAGIVLGIGGVAGHAHKGMESTSPGHFGRLQLLQNYSAVTGACLLVRRAVFLEVGGFDEDNFAVAYNDVDFCLRLRALGYRNLWTPHAVLLHHESATRGHENVPEKRLRLEEEHRRMRQKWAAWLDDDPSYNPNLALDREDFTVAWPPRLPRPDSPHVLSAFNAGSSGRR